MRVKDLSARPRSLEIEIEGSAAYEMATALYVVRGDEPRETLEIGQRWFDEVLASASPDLMEAIHAFDAGRSEIWISLWSLVYESAAPKGIGAFFAYLESIDPVALRVRLLAACPSVGDRAWEEVIRDAAAGDRGAQQRFLEQAATEHDGALVELYRAHLAVDPAADKARLLAILRRWYDEVFRRQEPRLAPALARDAEAKRQLARRQPPDRLIELATNGLRYTREAGVQRVLLFPSVVFRPWILISGYHDTKIFCYPAAEESLSGAPKPVSTRLIRLYKALADERRLQALQHLAARSYALQELADEMGVGKSLMHHHLNTLRAAGLIRVSVGDRWRYELRTETLAEMPDLLGAFLAGQPATEIPGTGE
jgi:DNA-binding transcriptional ArsR family regulator